MPLARTATDNLDSVREKATVKLADGVKPRVQDLRVSRKFLNRRSTLRVCGALRGSLDSGIQGKGTRYDPVGMKDLRIIRSWGNKRGCRHGDAGWTGLDWFENLGTCSHKSDDDVSIPIRRDLWFIVARGPKECWLLVGTFWGNWVLLKEG